MFNDYQKDNSYLKSMRIRALAEIITALNTVISNDDNRSNDQTIAQDNMTKALKSLDDINMNL